jgi:hypothetical protein
VANALNGQKLLSGRIIAAIPIQAARDGWMQKAQASACEYLVHLWPWETLETGMEVPHAYSTSVGSGAPDDAATHGAEAVHHPELEWPAVNYQVFKMGHSKPIMTGSQSLQRSYVGHSAYRYHMDASALAKRIAREIG